MPIADEVLADPAAEGDELDRLVSGLALNSGQRLMPMLADTYQSWSFLDSRW